MVCVCVCVKDTATCNLNTHTHREAVTEAICHMEAAVQLGADTDASWGKTCRRNLHLPFKHIEIRSVAQPGTTLL